MRYDLREISREAAPSGQADLFSRDRTAANRIETPRQPLVPTEHLTLPNGHPKEVVQTHDRTYRLRGRQTQTLAILGTFRVIDRADILHYADDTHALENDLRDDTHALENDLRSLGEQGLMAKDWLSTMSGARLHILTLTDRGKSLLDQAAAGDTRQHYRAGPADWYTVRHDTALYRMYQQEAGRLEAAGARIHRVISEDEIKRQYIRHVSDRVRGAPDPQRARLDARAGFAEAWGLPMLRDRMCMPDLRLEYVTDTGERAHLDLELTTERYAPEQVAAKVQAGFVMYRPAASTTHGGVPDGRLHPERVQP
jgi:hypothetical protein